MPQPNLDLLIGEAWGWPNEYCGLFAAFAGAANITTGTNPAYTLTDFRAIYPKFTSSLIPDAVLQVFVNLAQASVMQSRWQDSWTLAMALFIAHYATLWLRSDGDPQTTAGQAVAGGLTRGIATSKAVGDTSVSYEIAGSTEDWGTWNLTSYGQLFATMAINIGAGGMLIW